MPVIRYQYNPIITPQNIPPLYPNHEVIGVFNAGVAKYCHQTVLLLRIAERPLQEKPEEIRTTIFDAQTQNHQILRFNRQDSHVDLSDKRLIVTPGKTYLTSLSYLRVARSLDGRTFQLDPGVLLGPATAYESFGLEDPRITFIDGIYYIQYVAVSSYGVVTGLAKTEDFEKVERMGVIFAPENKDVAVFSGKVRGRYFAMHRPTSPFSQKNEMWIAESPDMVAWGSHRFLMGVQEGAWDSRKIGAGAPPVLIPEGWLAIYHGVDIDNCYSLGAVLMDTDEPWKVIARSSRPILEPETAYECEGFFGQVVFSCGVLLEDEILKIYYGAADTNMALVEVGLDEVLASLR